MNKKTKKNIYLLFILLIICSVTVVLTRKVLQQYALDDIYDPVSDVLKTELDSMVLRYQQNEIPSINLAEITPFSWDEVHLFGPYTPLSTLDNRFGFSWRKVCYTQINVSEGYTLFVFTESREVLHCFEYRADEYFFSTTDNLSGLPIERASFILDVETNRFMPLIP